MLENIRDHSIIVARVAALLAEQVNRAGLQLAPDLIVASALLHDIGKTACLDNDLDHALEGERICREHGMPEIAAIVGDHVRLRNFVLPRITENELVFYADKRVTHDRVVSLDQRRVYIIERYGRNDPARRAAIERHCRRWQSLEDEIFRFIEFSPAELAVLVDPDPSNCKYLSAGESTTCMTSAD